VPRASTFNLYTAENEVFQTSLYEIYRIIEDKEEPIDDDEKELLEKLPSKYLIYVEAFSKAASDTLPPTSSLQPSDPGGSR
jgi:hypothetical protein